MSKRRPERRRNDRLIIGLFAVVLMVQLLQAIELHDPPYLDVDATAGELLAGVPAYTERAKELTEFVLVIGGLAAALHNLIRGGRARREQ